jgi:23S rRNA (adenine2503-C2)-methyltransferase
MGMGEPFDNYDNVLQAARILADPKGFGFGKRHLTISTSGCTEGIRRFTAEEGDVPNLAVSVSAPVDDLRNRLMPINRKHNLQELYDSMLAYNQKTGRQVLIAYVLLEGLNDTLGHADKLAHYLQGLNVKINLIPYNPQSRDRYQPPSLETLEAFTHYLRNKGYYTLLRTTKGQSIMAACGQLGNIELRKQRKKTPPFDYNEAREQRYP